MLMDTGADISILPAHLYENTKDEYKQPLQISDKNIKAGNNTKCDTKGMAEIQLRIESCEKERMRFKQKFYVCGDATTPILGTDFMWDNWGVIDMRRQWIALWDKKVPCFDRFLCDPVNQISLCNDYILF